MAQRAACPGPVFVECPVDLLYDEAMVRSGTSASGRGKGGAIGEPAAALVPAPARALAVRRQRPSAEHAGGRRRSTLARAADAASRARRRARWRAPSGRCWWSAARRCCGAGARRSSSRRRRAPRRAGLPVRHGAAACSAANHPLQMRHERRKALREADLRDPGRRARSTSGSTTAAHRAPRGHADRRQPQPRRSSQEPPAASSRCIGDAGDASCALLAQRDAGGAARRWDAWLAQLRDRDDAREDEIDAHGRARAARGVSTRSRSAARSSARSTPTTLSGRRRRRLRGHRVVHRAAARAAALARPRRVRHARRRRRLRARRASWRDREAEVWLIWGDGSLRLRPRRVRHLRAPRRCR